MTTRLGGVSIPISLDLTEANRQIDELERRAVDLPIGDGGPGAQKRRAPGVRGGPQASWAGREEAPIRQMTRRQVERAFEQREAAQEKALKLRNVRDMARGTRHTAPPTDISQMPTFGQIPGAQRMASRFGLAGVPSMSDASTLALAAGVYAGARTIGMNAPYAAQAAGAPDSLVQGLSSLRQMFVTFEAEVRSRFTGFDKTLHATAAIANITGKMPSLPVPGVTSSSVYYQLFQKEDAAQLELKAKFDEFKGKEVAKAFGSYVRDSFKAAFTR